MGYMLDTNTCIYIIKRRPPALREKLEKIPMGRIAVSSIVVAELAYGIEHSTRKKHNRQAKSSCSMSYWKIGPPKRHGNTAKFGCTCDKKARLSAPWTF